MTKKNIYKNIFKLVNHSFFSKLDLSLAVQHTGPAAEALKLDGSVLLTFLCRVDHHSLAEWAFSSPVICFDLHFKWTVWQQALVEVDKSR